MGAERRRNTTTTTGYGYGYGPDESGAGGAGGEGLGPSRGPRHGLVGTELGVYAAFVELVGSLGKEEGLALITDAIKDAQEARLLRDYGGAYVG